MDEAQPPVILVRTWISLIKSKESQAVRDHATKMLLNAFGDYQSVISFCTLHEIPIN